MKLPNALLRPTGATALMLFWSGRGWPVFPLYGVHQVAGGDKWACDCRQDDCSSPGKHPLVRRGVTEATMDEAVIEQWGARWPNANVGGATTRRLVIDVDTYHGASWADVEEWRGTKLHRSGRGEGGHLVYSLSAEQRAMGLKSGTNKLGEGIDIRTGAGSYVVLPGSRHVGGGLYEETDDLVLQAPPDLVERLVAGGRALRAVRGEGGSGEAGGVTSLLSSLLSTPPRQGWNDWLTAVAGHYAKTYRRQRDLYDLHVKEAADKLNSGAAGEVTAPLTAKAVQKIADSVWRIDGANHPEREVAELCREDTGWLASGMGSGQPGRIMCIALEGPKEEATPVIAEWADFDLRVKGVIRDDDQTALYDLTLTRGRDGAEIATVVEAKILGDARKLGIWLAGFEVSIAQPDRVAERSPAVNVKLLRYLSSQNAPQIQLAKWLGWHEDAGFLTHTGVIVGGLAAEQPWAGVRPDPRLVKSGTAGYAYGFHGRADEAVSVLREVLTFHEDDSVAVFGAWWAASLIKHIITRQTSVFPVLAIEAASGAGKTNGFFAMMMKLGGATRGEGHYTVASLRNALSANANGTVWVDDLDDPARIHELIRVLTGEGTLSKMSEDRTTVTAYSLVGSLVLSGEALALDGQKALLERTIVLRPGVPIGRLSLRNIARPQWHDIMELEERSRTWGKDGLSEIAGHLVARALELGERLDLAEIKKIVGGGRTGERALVMLAGARLLDAMVADTGRREEIALAGGGQFATRVAAWLDLNIQVTPFDDNRLTLELIPWALRSNGMASTAYHPGGGQGAWIDPDGTVWFSPVRLAEVWREYRHGVVDTRTETVGALQAQARQLVGGGGAGTWHKQFRTSKHGSGAKQTYWSLPAGVGAVMVRRAEGLPDTGAEDQGLLV